MKAAFTCLLIDDDIDDQEIFLLALEEVNTSVTCNTASRCTEALELLSSEAIPDFIFLDLNMPGMDGKEFLREIKKDEKLSQIPVVIYSTSSDPKDLRITRELGAFDYIIKQSSIVSLRKILEKFFNRQQISNSN